MTYNRNSVVFAGAITKIIRIPGKTFDHDSCNELSRLRVCHSRSFFDFFSTQDGAGVRQNRRVILSWVKALGGVSWRMRKNEKSPISIGPQFYTLLALTETIVTELRWGLKKGRRSGKTSERLVEQPRHIRRRLTGKLKMERL
jgi:hypothetical protein